MRVASLSWVSATLILAACNPGGETPTETASETQSESGPGESESESETGDPPELDTFGFVNGCYSVRAGDSWLATTASGQNFEFSADQGAASRFFMKASDLGTYLFYDEDGGYLVAEAGGGPLLRQTSLQSDVLLIDDSYVSGAEWLPETSLVDWDQYQLRNRRTDQLLGENVVAAEGLPVTLEPATGCREHPELTLDASGQIMKTTFDDGTLYGIVDTHSHILSNFAFGGGGIFHGAPFHRLGVEHALPDCEPFHGVMGRKDFFGFAFDQAGNESDGFTALIPDLVAGELSEDNHPTAGYPEFTDWPNGPTRSTHQTQYYRWLERAWLGGLRLVVQHATTNSIICHFMVGEGIEHARYDCEDMTAVDRIIDETYAMQDYIDAQSGGPGLGWFRIVMTPAEARSVIASGKLAVILGIETSNVFDCYLTPPGGAPTCDEDYVREQLDFYYDLGIRALFPVHKYDNAFSPGDGDRAFIELGNMLNSGHWSNFDLNCPTEVYDGFDQGNVNFGGLNMPRDVYDAPAVHNFSAFPDMPIEIASLFFTQIVEPPLEGDYCQNATMTPLGETLLLEMMARGMIIEVDHLPQWSYVRAFELLQENDYPASGSHSRNFNGLLYQLGGVAQSGFGRCHDANNPGSSLAGYLNRIQLIENMGGYPAEGFGFDLNGFAGAPGPRFAEGACATPQENPITYPFTSYAGDVEFTEPVVGNRTLDFNNEGLVHIGLLPELIEDVRHDAVDDADLEPLFRSAEGYIRMWERAEERAAALGGG